MKQANLGSLLSEFVVYEYECHGHAFNFVCSFCDSGRFPSGLDQPVRVCRGPGPGATNVPAW